MDDANLKNTYHVIDFEDDIFLYSNEHFTPIRTAYKGIENVLATKRIEQREVLIPFHFLPEILFNNQGKPFSFITKANSPFANKILDNG